MWVAPPATRRYNYRFAARTAGASHGESMALGFMRRHRRWLYGFLWVVIAAFIILYIPAFTGTADQRSAGATLVEVGSLPITVGEYQKAYQRQREMYQNLYRVDAEAIKRLGLEEQTLQGLIDDRVLQLE